MKTQPVHRQSYRNTAELPCPAFTLVELLTVIAVLAVIMSILLPSLAKASVKSRAIPCLGNTRAIALGELMYASDNEDRITLNQEHTARNWVSGKMDFTGSPDNTNTSLLLDAKYALLAPYVQAASFYKCPTDKSMVGRQGARAARVRSYSMNVAMGRSSTGDFPFSPGWRSYQRTSDMAQPGPARLWLFVEEHVDSIDDGIFIVDCVSKGAQARLISIPANDHDGTSNFSFADGHSEIRRWQDTRTIRNNEFCGCIASYAKNGFYTDTPNNSDVAWLQAGTSSPVSSRLN